MVSSQLMTPTSLDRPKAAGATWTITTTPEGTNGAPCLGLAVLAGSAIWLGLGSGLTLLLM
jgi:hypothetical protein